MANKNLEKEYGPGEGQTNQVTLYFEKNWKHFDELNKIKKEGGNVSKTFISAFEKQIEGYATKKDLDEKFKDHLDIHHNKE